MTNVLIITGNKLVRWSLKEVLAQEGFLTDVALTRRDYLAKIANNSYDLIIVDFEARKTDDVAILERIEELCPAPNIIVLSTSADEQMEAFLNRPNVVSVIMKPFSVDQIRTVAQAALASPRANEGGGKLPR